MAVRGEREDKGKRKREERDKVSKKLKVLG